MKKLGILFLIFISSCAAYRTFNQTTTGKVRFPGGVQGKEVWDDAMYFRRASWYHGMTLYYDALIYTADEKSPFTRWFSPAEREYFQKCEKLLVTVNYAADATKISHVMFREQMRQNGFDDVVVNSFASYIRTHPTFQAWNLQNYKILGYCKRQTGKVGDINNLLVNFPSFTELKIKI
ncbi:MAG: hypothetical protein K2P81_08065 [Bacteriovoracaceae bacterium]|nr:hypothetical protein [Bacteriovoracaceae bacterium]